MGADMKLPFTTRDTASLLQKEIAAEAEAAAKLVDMRAARAQALLETDNLAVIEKLDADIVVVQRQISIHQDRILALDARGNDEAAEAHAKEYAAGVALIERLTPMREQAAGEVEGAIVALASAVRKFVEVSGSIVNQWPATLGTKPGYHLGSRAIGELIRNCFANSVLVYSTTKAPPPASDYVRRACDSNERAAGFADATRSDHVELLAGLRQNGVPAAPVTDHEEEAAVA
jgi:hypothetical protein